VFTTVRPVNPSTFIIGAPPIGSSDDTDIFLQYSDNSGNHWSDPVRVHEDSIGRSQFLPRLAVDQTTGSIAVGYYDSGNDPQNKKASYYVSLSRDGGRTFTYRKRAALGASDSSLAPPYPVNYYENPFDFGDYSSIDFYRGRLLPAWGDNSDSTGDNPPGNAMELFTSKLRVW
jgi:hypothetical protein